MNTEAKKSASFFETGSVKTVVSHILRILILLVLISGCDTGNRKKPAVSEKYQDKKNILFIVSDDLATHAIGAYGNDLVRTPNIDRLAESGVRFTSAFCTSPICTPSRASLLTGRYPHAAGTTLLNTALPEEQEAIAEHLADRGYATGMFGKTHFNSEFPGAPFAVQFSRGILRAL